MYSTYIRIQDELRKRHPPTYLIGSEQHHLLHLGISQQFLNWNLSLNTFYYLLNY